MAKVNETLDYVPFGGTQIMKRNLLPAALVIDVSSHTLVAGA